jgi:hypothetical protein
VSRIISRKIKDVQKDNFDDEPANGLAKLPKHRPKLDGWFLEVEMQGGFAVSGLEMGKEIPGADHGEVAMESLATSGLRNARLSTLSSRSHRRRLRGTQRIYIWHSWALALANGARYVRNSKDSRFFSWASWTLGLAICVDTTSQSVGEHGNRISRNLAFCPRPRGLPHALPILTPVPSPF